MSDESIELAQLKRLKWRCRRGLKELDVILERFLAQGFTDLSAEHKQDFSELLEQQDLDLLAWFTGKSNPPKPQFKTLIDLIHRS